MREIVIYPAKVLRVKAEFINEVDKSLIREIKDLKKVLEKAENGAGLAAPQVGVSKRFFGIKDNKIGLKVILNPKIKKTWGDKVYPKMPDDKGNQEDFLEGCLSFPNFWGTVRRWLKVEVEWQELVGKKLILRNKKLEGFEAIVWQHESDHLDGVVFLDHIKEDKGKFYKSVNGEMVKWDVDEVLK